MLPPRPRAKASAACPRAARSGGGAVAVDVAGTVGFAGGGAGGVWLGPARGQQCGRDEHCAGPPHVPTLPDTGTRGARAVAGPRADRTVPGVGTPFVPGRELGRRFYREAVRPLLDGAFPGLPHAAAHLVGGSDVLGLDTAMSRDHDWGPAVALFLRDEDAGRAPAIRELMRDRLPRAFLGYPTGFVESPDEPGTDIMAAGTDGPAEHRVVVGTVRSFAVEHLGWDPAGRLAAADWLSFPSQQLLSINAGPVHHDGVGELAALRRRLAWYPHDVWLYLLAAGWTRLGQEEHLLGRAGHAGDELGSAVIGARLVRDAMALGFLLERRYAPYPKWFGTAFGRLSCAPALQPLLREVLRAESWPARQDAYAATAEALLRTQNALGLTDPLPARASLFFGRPFWVIWGDRVATALVGRILDPEVRRLTGRRLIGGVDQWSDSTDIRSDVEWRPVIRRFYTDE